MNIETRSQSKSKNKSRQEIFYNNRGLSKNQDRRRSRPVENLNSSSLPTIPKVRKVQNKTKDMESEGNNRMSQFVDLSGSIMNTGVRVNAEEVSGNNGPSVQASTQGEYVPPEVRGLVVDEALSVQRTLEEKIKKMVKDEMLEMRNSISDLARAIQSLTRSGSNARNNDLQHNDNSRPVNNVNNSGHINGTNETVQPTADNNVVLSTNGGIPNGLVPHGNSFNSDAHINGLSGSSRVGVTNVACDNGCHRNNSHQNYDFPTRNYPTQRNEPMAPCSTTNYGEKIWIRVDKFGINFDGNTSTMAIEDFIFRLEHLQAHYNIPWEEVLRDFHVLVSGSAREWYWWYLRHHCVSDWQSLRAALTSRYQAVRSNFEVMRDLVEKRQNPNESIDTYFQAMCQLRAKLTQQIPEYDMIRILKRNIKESIGKIVYPMAISSVEQLRVECNEAEKTFGRKETRMPIHQTMRSTRHVSELEDEMEDTNCQHAGGDEISAIRLKQPKSTLVCWNCKVPGHVFMDCPSTERALFCYKCGKPNVITPKCPVCQEGNQKRGEKMTGDSRRTEHPAQ